MYKHIVYTEADGSVAQMGLDYFNRSDVRHWTRPGKLSKNGGDPLFIGEDGVELTLSNGGLICPDDDLSFADDGSPVCSESTADFVARVIRRHVPERAPYEVIDTRVWVSQPDKNFREAWVLGQGRMNVGMPKARIIHMDRIRKVRDIELEQESGSRFRQPPELEALFTPARQLKLQILRDIPQTFDLSVYATPEALKAAWPVELQRPGA